MFDFLFVLNSVFIISIILVTNNASLCHFDGSSMEEGVEDMINSLKRINNNCTDFELFITGGFIENTNYSKELTLNLFSTMINLVNLK